MLLDLHVHTNRYSWCSAIDPVLGVQKAREIGLDGLVIVEHDIVWKEEELEDLKRQLNLDGFVILRAQEINCNTEQGFKHGHLLTYSYFERYNYLLPTRGIIDQVHRAGGVAVAAHPYRPRHGFGNDVYDLQLDGIEVLHPKHTTADREMAEHARKSLNIASIGGSDAHAHEEIGACLTYFQDWISNEEDLAQAIRSMRCKPITREEMADYRRLP
ncbi:MAG: hypothetical protein HY730_03230 [Candidatus Tectomicrobia bacterium]|uniref:Polymerase/histidinol phosphatase N-terminal domain-containing protein n=1 Tax=Tectimicrobiota bacterium TaxID=2528274 RepID=A0A933GK76_UNCTE|nr:hypothetical protein [Candidatus Tectomicrobia bacterium]